MIKQPSAQMRTNQSGRKDHSSPLLVVGTNDDDVRASLNKLWPANNLTISTATVLTWSFDATQLLFNHIHWSTVHVEAHPLLNSSDPLRRYIAQLHAILEERPHFVRNTDLRGMHPITPAQEQEEHPHYFLDSLAHCVDLYSVLADIELAPRVRTNVESLLGIVLDRVHQDFAKVIRDNDKSRQHFLDVITTSSYARFVNWTALRQDVEGLAILYNFSPFADTGSSVASKRLREFGHTVDVLSCSSLNRKKLDPTIDTISRPYVAQRVFLDQAPSWATWRAFERFCLQGLKQIEALESKGRQYQHLYSRAMWAPSHYLAAAYKKQNPVVDWLAEFSDPLSLDVEGNPRGGVLDRSPFLNGLLNGVEETFGPIPEQHFTIFGIAEILPFAQAETILFTNDLQRETMIQHIYSPSLRERVQEKSQVINHPTLPQEYYEVGSSTYKTDPAKLNLAYFGEFYATRGLTDLTTAMRMLPPHICEKVNLHVFTNFVPADGLSARPAGMQSKDFSALVQRAQDGVGGSGLESQIFFNASLPYLDFLGVMENFDFLIVNDAHSGANHSVNPYLPSKWSDYSGSKTDVWAFVEEGSVLSTKPATVKTPIGDPNAARALLWRLVDEKLERMNSHG